VTSAVIKTFYAHGRRKAKKLMDRDEKEEATDDIFFDEYVSSNRVTIHLIVLGHFILLKHLFFWEQRTQ